MDESVGQPQPKASLVEVAKQRIAQPKVWIPLAIAAVATAFVLLFIINLQESTLSPLFLKPRDWTGFGESSTQTTATEMQSDGKTVTKIIVTNKKEDAKTFWDWLSVLGVPLTLALLGFWFQWLQQKQAVEQAEVERRRVKEQAAKEQARADELAKAEQTRAKEQADVDKEIAETNRKEEAIQAYFDRLSDLLVDKNLIMIASKVQSFEAEAKAAKAKEEGSGSEAIKLPASLQAQKERLDAAVDVIRARTLAILRRLKDDADRKTSVMQFLIEAEVIQKLKLSLECADLSGADLSYAYLSGADLRDAKLSGADLRDAKLSGADLRDAKLSGADLSGADLSGADLSGADLSGADLSETNLSEANLSGAKLNSARNLTEEQLTQARLCKTKLPPGIDLNPDRDFEELGFYDPIPQ